MADPNLPGAGCRSQALYDLTNAITVAWGRAQLMQRQVNRGRYRVDPRLQLSLDALELALAEAAAIRRAIKTA